jgi:bacteriocin-like protein
MTKKLTGKETKVTQKPKKPVAAELQDDELQQVTGGLQSTGPTMPGPTKPCITDFSF